MKILIAQTWILGRSPFWPGCARMLPAPRAARSRDGGSSSSKNENLDKLTSLQLVISTSLPSVDSNFMKGSFSFTFFFSLLLAKRFQDIYTISQISKSDFLLNFLPLQRSVVPDCNIQKKTQLTSQHKNIQLKLDSSLARVQ